MDLKENAIREVGDVFELTKVRFAEISALSPKTLIEEVAVEPTIEDEIEEKAEPIIERKAEDNIEEVKEEKKPKKPKKKAGD